MHYPKLTGFSKRLWQQSLPIFEKVTQTPLVRGLIEGLDPEHFVHFSQQDVYYLEKSFQPAMAELSQKASDPKHQALFASFIEATNIEVLQLKSQIQAQNAKVRVRPSEVCTNYGNHLKINCKHSYRRGLIGCLPCFLFFPAVGAYIKSQVKDLSGHPQAAWIKIYAEELFDNAYYMAALANEAIGREAKDEEELIKIYKASAEFELAFFEDALALEESAELSMKMF